MKLMLCYNITLISGKFVIGLNSTKLIPDFYCKKLRDSFYYLS